MSDLFTFARYANVWEDTQMLLESLQPVAKGKRLLSIASAGDNVLGLLTLDPSEVVAVDLNPAQLACLELRMATFRHLEHEGALSFLGVTDAVDRLQVFFHRLQNDLTPESKDFWLSHSADIAAGIIHMGKFERYFHLFARRVLPLIHSKDARDELLKPKTLADQAVFCERVWNNRRWRLLFHLYFSRSVMGRLGRDPSFFKHAEDAVAGNIFTRTKTALCAVPTHNNPYLRYIISGNFHQEALPLYLRKEHFCAIKERVDRITWIKGSVTNSQVRGPFAGFNLSDIFEYMDDMAFAQCYASLIELVEPNTRLVYWNMMVPRSGSILMPGKIKPLTDLSQRLLATSQTWFYRNFHIDEYQDGSTSTHF